ncbi:MAG: HAMP domain-containing protein [Nitrospirae bacterium]|nr:HAMP domain-containing protein [Candidatus Troglogloeales bacterium]MBI3598931.1 HAMP domain-containing protein [Candidatus Troglogloeales bacterium]
MEEKRIMEKTPGPTASQGASPSRSGRLLARIMGLTLFILLLGFGLFYMLFGPTDAEKLYLGLGAVLFLSGVITFAVYITVLLPVRNLGRRILEISDGDLSGRLNQFGNDEIGAIAFGFNRFAERLTGIVPQIFSAAQKVSTTSSNLMVGSREIMQGAAVQVDAIEATSIYIGEMNGRISNMTDASSKLAISSKESANATYQMTSAVEDIAKNTTFLAASVDDASTAILAMSSEIQKIDKNVENLLIEAESTSASMIEMDQSLKGTRMNILEMVELAHEVNSNADLGRKKVELTRDGISRIKTDSKAVYEAVRTVERQTGNIGKFLDVIDDMADQTNLLALNAEIIAAQEGEHGRSFSVVANEIKELAERTAASTHEIHEIIRALQSQAKTAVEAIEIGNGRIDEGVTLSKFAQEALEKIYDSINRSTQRTTMVANTMEEQSRVVRQVGTSMMRVNERVQEIAKATGEQDKKSEKIIEAAYRMKSITESLQEAMLPHSRGMKKVKEVAETVSRMAREIADDTLKQKGKSEEIVRAIDQIKRVTRETVDTVEGVGNSVEELIREAALLEKDIFDVQSNFR